MMGALSSILLAGCAQFAEMEATRETGSAYLTGKFDEQICELEAIAEKSPELGYSTARIVQEVIPQRGSGVSWILKTKQAPPQAKIRYYGSKVEYPTKKEELDAWMKAIDDNVAKLKDKINAAAEEAKRKEEERIAKEKAAAEEAKRRAAEQAEEDRRKEEERIAKEKAAAEEAKRKEAERIAEAAKLVAGMPESEKFPLLSVQPKPQMLMKGVPSGASLKWVQGWLLANKIKHEDPEDLFDGSRVMIRAYFYDDANELKRKVQFLFFDGALVEVIIIPRNFTVTVSVAKDKYLQQFGTTAKVDEREKACRKIWASDFSRSGFPVNGEGFAAIYTDDIMAGINYYITNDKYCDKILLTDRVLSKYAEETIQRKKEAEAKAKEDAKKAKAAAALDF